jgi:hypothetical protein
VTVTERPAATSKLRHRLVCAARGHVWTDGTIGRHVILLCDRCRRLMAVTDPETVVPTTTEWDTPRGLLGDAEGGRRAVALLTSALTGEPAVVELLEECVDREAVLSLLILTMRVSHQVPDLTGRLQTLATEHERTLNAGGDDG